MPICVEIEVGDDGAVRVGVDPREEEKAQGAPGVDMSGSALAVPEAEDKPYLQPAKSIEDALSTARDLLTNPQAQSAAAGPDQAMPGEEQAAAAKSFNSIRGGPSA